MAQEGREAWRAASRFPLSAGARCEAVVEKPANNGPRSGVRGARTPSWALGGGGEGLREVGGGEVDRGEREEEDRRRGEKEEKRERREENQRQISSEIQKLALEKAEEEKGNKKGEPPK